MGDVKAVPLCDLDADADGSTCGERINWLTSHGWRNSDARDQVAKEFPSICGNCANATVLYGVLRYIKDGPSGFAVFNLGDSEAMAIIEVPAQLRGLTVSDCASSTGEESLPLGGTYTVKVPAYSFKMIG